MCTQTQYQILTATPTYYALDFSTILCSLPVMANAILGPFLVKNGLRVIVALVFTAPIQTMR